MNRRLIIAVASAGTVGLITLGTCTAMAADTAKPKADLANSAPFCTAVELAPIERIKLRVATRSGTGEERAVSMMRPRMALVLGVGF